MKKIVLLALACASLTMPIRADYADSVNYWVGTGQYSAVMIIHWMYANTAIAVGYKWSSNNTKVGDMMSDVDNAMSDLSFDGVSAGFLNDARYDNSCIYPSVLSQENSTNRTAEYFMYAVNGVMAPEGLGTMTLHNGDEVHWFLTSNYAAVPSLTNVHMYYPPFAAVKTCSATVCEGQDYNANGFNIRATELSTNKINLFLDTTTSIAGCDTLLKLSLTVLPTKRTVIDTTVNGTNFVWYDSVYTQSTTDSIVLTSTVGCDSVLLLHLTLNLPSAIDIVGTTAVMLYPNPTADMLHVEGIQSGCMAEILDAMGNIALRTRTDGDINVSALPTGVYMLRLMDIDGHRQILHFVRK